MAKDTSKPPQRPLQALRERAEEVLQTKVEDKPNLPTADVQSLLHELRVHQMELEIQNEELRNAQLELSQARDRYADLYEFAPVGYLALDPDGRILDANLTATTMLGLERKTLLHKKLADYVTPETQDALHLHRQALLSTEDKETAEIEVRQQKGNPLPVRLESLAVQYNGNRQFRIALLDLTDRKETELLLQKLNIELGRSLDDRTSELKQQVDQINLLKNAISKLGEGVVITTNDLDWPGPKIVFVNDAMCRISGYEAHELIDQTPRILQGEATNRATLKRIRTELSEKGQVIAELINHRKDGAAYHAEVFIMALQDDEGRRTNYVSIHRDITDRIKKDEALREREELLRAILDATVDSIIAITRKGSIVDINSATERLFGYTRAELVGKNVNMLMPSPYREEHDHSLNRYAETREPHIIGVGREVEAQRKDGSIFSAHLAVRKVEGLSLYAGVIRDISEHKRAEKELRHENQFNETIIATAHTVILILDLKGRIVRFNPYFEKLTGWSLDEVEGRDWFKTFLPEHHHKTIKALFRKTIRGTPTRGNVNPILTRDGEERLIEWYDSTLTDEGGNTVGLLCTGNDITDRRNLEQDVIKASEEERLRIANDLHDGLGSLLTGIKLRSETLGRALSGKAPQQAAHTNAIVELVQDAIGMTRAIAHGLRPVGTDPEDLISALEKLSAHITTPGKLHSRFLCPQRTCVDDPIVANHLFRIAQEATNNAARHSGGSSIVISLKALQNTLELQIFDNGAGFDGYIRREAGLGLKIMKYRADVLNGTLQIRPRKKNRGTKVICSIPLPPTGPDQG